MRKKSKKKIMLCVQVPVDTHKKFKAYAKERDFSMKFFVIQDIERRLAEVDNSVFWAKSAQELIDSGKLNPDILDDKPEGVELYLSG